MTEPVTVNCLFTTPNTGDLSGTWGSAAINPVITALDGRFGGATSIALTNANVTLTTQAGTATPGAGPTQADNAVIKLTGTLTGNPVITLPLPGYYIIKNSCTVGTHYIQVRAAGTGNVIGLPEGKASKVWNDGTDCDFCDPMEVGSYMDLAMSTLPAWMTACTVTAFLICDGTIYNNSNFTALGARLGSAFGGNGVTTFGVPDYRGRSPLYLDNQGGSAAGRVTNAISSINATTLGASGGNQSMQQHTHTATDSGHSHSIAIHTANLFYGSISQAFVLPTGTMTTGTSTAVITVQNTGSGSSQNMPPVMVGGMRLIKT